MTMPDGSLTNRYVIIMKDGVPVDSDKQYLVLDISNPDTRELAALYAFIDRCYATGYTQLATDLEKYTERFQ